MKTDEETLHLPHGHAVLQLFWKASRVGGGVEGFEDESACGLMMTVTCDGIVIGDDDIRAELANLENHPAQRFITSPDAKRFVGGLRETEIAQAQKVRFGALNLRGLFSLARANRAQLFVEFRPDVVLPTFTES